MSFRKIVGILTAILVILCMVSIIQNQPTSKVPTYVEITHSIYKLSNECIAEHYYNDLTSGGKVFSLNSVVPECNGERLQTVKVKIFDTDGEQETNVKAYQLHGVMIKLGGNATFFEKAIIRRIDNDEVVNDITDAMRQKETQYERNPKSTDDARKLGI